MPRPSVPRWTRIWWVRPVPRVRARRGREVARGRLETVVGQRALAALDHGHALAIARMAPDRPLDRAGRGRRPAPDDRRVAALDPMDAELGREPHVGAVVLGDHHEPARVLVEAMDDARPQHPADARQAAGAMRQERVDQRAAGMARRRMDHEAGRLVEHQEMRVLVQDVERDRLGRRASPASARAGRPRTAGPV